MVPALGVDVNEVDNLVYVAKREAFIGRLGHHGLTEWYLDKLDLDLEESRLAVIDLNVEIEVDAIVWSSWRRG